MSQWLNEVRAGVRLVRTRRFVEAVRGAWCWWKHEPLWTGFVIGTSIHLYCPKCGKLRDDF